MGKKTEMLALPTRVLAVELGSKKRWRRVVVLAGIGAVVLAGIVIAVIRAAESKSQEALSQAWTDLNGCLLGTAPLGEKESPSARATAVQLAVVGLPKERRGKPGEPAWPQSCAPSAFSVAELAGASENGEALKASADALAKALKDDAGATADMAPLVDKLFADAKKGNLKSAASGKGPTPPAVANILFPREAFTQIPAFLSGNFLLSAVREPASKAPPRLAFLVDGKDAAGGPVLCTATPADTAVRCVKVSAEAAKLSPGLTLSGTTEDRAQPFYFAGDRGALGIFAPSGDKPVGAGVSPGSVSRADGSFLALLMNERTRDLSLLVAPPTKAPSTRPLLTAGDLDTAVQAGLFWDWLVYKTSSRTGTARLVARKIGKDGPEGAPIEIGNADEPSPQMDKDTGAIGCRSDEGLAVRISGGSADVVALFAGGRWAAPVKTATKGGSLSCRGVEAFTTQVTHGQEQNKDFPTFRQSKCAASGCTTSAVTMREMLAGATDIAPADAGSISAADVNGKLLVVWNAGSAGGLRMRFAPVELLKDAPDAVITDGRDATGSAKGSILSEVRVLSGGTFAIVLVGTTAGVRALFVDGTGAVKPASSAM